MPTDEQPKYEGWTILEEWRPAIGFEGLYEVSDWGRVRRVGCAARHGVSHGGGARIGRVLRDQWNRGGYRAVQLWKNGSVFRRLLHKVVAAAFIGECPTGQEVNHRDGDKTNNRPANLEFVTRAENNRHAYRTGLKKPRVDQMVAARKKPRLLIQCGCGCGTQIESLDRKARPRRFVTGHNMRKAS